MTIQKLSYIIFLVHSSSTSTDETTSSAYLPSSKFPQILQLDWDTNALSGIKVGVVFPTALVTSRISLFISTPAPKFRYNIAGAHEYIYLNNGFSPHRSSVNECKAIALITRIRRIGIGNCFVVVRLCEPNS